MNTEGVVGQFSCDHVTRTVVVPDQKTKVKSGRLKEENVSTSNATNVDHMVCCGQYGTKGGKKKQIDYVR